MNATDCRRHAEIVRRVLREDSNWDTLWLKPPITAFPRGTGIPSDHHACALCEVCAAADKALESQMAVKAARGGPAHGGPLIRDIRAKNDALRERVEFYQSRGLDCRPPTTKP